MRRVPSIPPAVALAAALLAGCGNRSEQPEGDGSGASGAATPVAAEVVMTDIRPPVFGGLESVELDGLDYFHLTWSPATDDVSPPEAIRYAVFHLVEPYLELAPDARPIFTSQPGATDAYLANDAPPGRFYVRAIDEAGNASALAPGIIQRPERPLLRATDGTVAARITGCAETGPGRALCVGEDGFAALWTPDGWESLDLGIATPFRLADTPGGIFVYTSVGHLFRLDEAGTPHLVDVRFPRNPPELPFRQFTADGVGLRYWIDATGRVFVGADREFVPMIRPLALPGEDCRRLRGLAFGDRGSFALCEGGAAFSADPTAPGARWLSLTPNADFVVPAGLTGVLADSDTEAWLVDTTGIRRVGVGGWSPVLLTDWRQPGIHPMDIPEDPPDIRHIAQVFRHDGTLHAATDGGLLVYEEAEWRVQDGIDEPLAGVVGPGAGLAPSEWAHVFEDGSVAQLRRGEVRWAVERDMTGFVAGYMSSTGEPIARVEPGPRQGFYLWRDRRWQPLFAAPDPTVELAGFAGSTATGIVGFGAERGAGQIWRPDRGSWASSRWLYPPPPDPEEAGRPATPTDPGEMVFEAPEPPPPLRGVDADELPAQPRAREPIVHVDVTPDGRAVAVGAHQVWWRTDRGWLLVAERPGVLSAAFVDAGETYVVIEDGAPVRCWRSDCRLLVPQVEGGPTRVLRPFMGASGWELVEADGTAWRFVPAESAGTAQLVDPAVQTPVGSWASTPSVGRFAADLNRRVAGDGFAALQTRDGAVYEQRDGDWVLQAEGGNPLTVLAVDEGWAILTSRGLFRLGEVRPARRETPAP